MEREPAFKTDCFFKKLDRQNKKKMMSVNLSHDMFLLSYIWQYGDAVFHLDWYGQIRAIQCGISYV